MSSVVLDASALLALIYQEPGADDVERAVATDAVVSTVNLAEVVAKLQETGLAEEAAREALASLDIEVVPFDQEAAYEAGLLRAATRAAGLSLGDRACLALARRRGLPVLTTDRAWRQLALGVEVLLVRS